LLALALSACSAAAPVPATAAGPGERTATVPAVEPVALACLEGADLSRWSPDGRAPLGALPRPPARLTSLAAAGSSLVGVAGARVLRLRGGAWEQVADLGRHGGGAVVRAGTRGGVAFFWIAGDVGGLVAGRLDVPAEGATTFQPGGGDPDVRLAPAALGTLPLDDPPLLARLAQAAGQPVDAVHLAFAEPSPWGGRLVALEQEAQEGDLPPEDALFYLPPSGAPAALAAGGRALSHRDLVGYGPGGLLLVGAAERSVLIGPDLAVRPVGAKGWCVFLPSLPGGQGGVR
jgi:hypothetical protein